MLTSNNKKEYSMSMIEVMQYVKDNYYQWTGDEYEQEEITIEDLVKKLVEMFRLFFDNCMYSVGQLLGHYDYGVSLIDADK